MGHISSLESPLDSPLSLPTPPVSGVQGPFNPTHLPCPPSPPAHSPARQTRDFHVSPSQSHYPAPEQADLIISPSCSHLFHNSASPMGQWPRPCHLASACLSGLICTPAPETSCSRTSLSHQLSLATPTPSVPVQRHLGTCRDPPHLEFCRPGTSLLLLGDSYNLPQVMQVGAVLLGTELRQPQGRPMGNRSHLSSSLGLSKLGSEGESAQHPSGARMSGIWSSGAVSSLILHQVRKPCLQNEVLRLI